MNSYILLFNLFIESADPFNNIFIALPFFLWDTWDIFLNILNFYEHLLILKCFFIFNGCLKLLKSIKQILYPTFEIFFTFCLCFSKHRNEIKKENNIKHNLLNLNQNIEKKLINWKRKNCLEDTFYYRIIEEQKILNIMIIMNIWGYQNQIRNLNFSFLAIYFDLSVILWYLNQISINLDVYLLRLMLKISILIPLIMQSQKHQIKRKYMKNQLGKIVYYWYFILLIT